MAALVLSIAGASLGGSLLGGLAGTIAGRLVGAVAGNVIDQALFGNRISNHVEGPRLSDLSVMSSSEGAPIPRGYGRFRLSGQVIWATSLEEVVNTDTTTAGGKGAPRVSTTETTYSYFANFAVGLCEGQIGRILRVWADGKPLDLTGIALRSYPGDETQEPDPLIVAKEGNAPAYRGLAYVVFERMPLANFGNRIPQLSFEIVRPIGALETLTRAVTLIPGTTEFGYEPATVTQVTGPGQYAAENRHVGQTTSDVIASLDELQVLCPNLERVAIVVAWFGDDLRAGHCTVKPGADSATKQTHGATWSVDGLARADAHLVSQVSGRAAYGGTPSDDSVTHLIGELKSRGIKVTLYPFLVMDVPAGNALGNPYTGTAPQPAYPWRGRITCDPAPGVAGSPDGTSTAADQVNAFFSGGDWNYRRMILHYADLAAAAGGVDAFLIGSELRGLTRIRSASGVYPAVEALVALAGDVRAILGSGTTITYGADWTEYGAHVVDGAANEVRFPLDPLWACDAIDAIGVDYYAPLSDWRDSADHLDRALASSIYDQVYLAGNLRRGEAYDFYYADKAARTAQTRTPITDGLGKPWMFRQKDLWSWWASWHNERVDGAELATPTAWVPQGKPIWLTEIGCPAVDKGANQPSVFPDPKSSENFFPYFSTGRRDDLIQRRMLEAVLVALDPAFGALEFMNPVSSVYGERMIVPDGIHLWTWDARPYPVFPAALDVWSDGANWETGHWLNGRLGTTPLDNLVTTILKDCAIEGVSCDPLTDSAEGYVVDRPMTPRAMIEPLALAYGFDATADGASLRFIARGSAPVAELTEDDLLLPQEGPPLRLARAQETELPREVSLGFIDVNTDYASAESYSRRLVGGSAKLSRADLAVVTSDTAAARRADIWLQDLWAGRESAQFALPPSALRFGAGDVVAVTASGRRRLLEVQEISDAEARIVKARSIDPDVFDLPLEAPRRKAPAIPAPVAPVEALALDLPMLDAGDPPILTRLALFADPWPGPEVVWRSADGLSFESAGVTPAPATIGETLDPLPRGPVSRFDRNNAVQVKLYGGVLSSVTDIQLFGGANAAVLQQADGSWEVIQFANAELVGDKTYRLSRLLRGQAGSEWAISDLLPAGARFVLLNGNLFAAARGVEALERALQLRLIVSGRDYSDPATLPIEILPQPTALLPLAPVHLKARRDGAGVSFSWIRRTRIGGDAWTNDVPLGEEREAYELDILSGASVLRTLSATTPTALYAAANELTDLGAPQTSVWVALQQVSATVGRGIAAAAILSP